MKLFLYRLAASHGHATTFVRVFHALTGWRYALRPIPVRTRSTRRF